MSGNTSFTEFLRARGAVLEERNGQSVIAHFGDAAAEYRAVRSAAGLIDFTGRGLLQFTGADRVSFLQGMLSNDVKSLKPFEGECAALLTQHGKVIADVRVLCAMNSFYLDFWEPLKDNVLDHLNRYLVADEVEIADRTSEYGIISLQGPRAEALLRIVAGQAPLPARPKQHAMVTLQQAAACVVQDSHTGEPGFDLIIPQPALTAVAGALTEAGGAFSARWVGATAQDVLRIEAGIPRYGIDFGEDHLLLETGLNDAVSFTKGCYLGQEVIERIRSRGHVNKKLLGVILAGSEPLAPGDAVWAAAKEIGQITSWAFSPAIERTIALAYIHRDFWSAGTPVEVRHGGVARPAAVADLPFVNVFRPS